MFRLGGQEAVVTCGLVYLDSQECRTGVELGAGAGARSRRHKITFPLLAFPPYL